MLLLCHITVTKQALQKSIGLWIVIPIQTMSRDIKHMQWISERETCCVCLDKRPCRQYKWPLGYYSHRQRRMVRLPLLKAKPSSWALLLSVVTLPFFFVGCCRTQHPKGDIVKPSPPLQYYWQHYNPLGSRSEQGRPEGPILWVLKVIYNPLFCLYQFTVSWRSLKTRKPNGAPWLFWTKL